MCHLESSIVFNISGYVIHLVAAVGSVVLNLLDKIYHVKYRRGLSACRWRFAGRAAWWWTPSTYRNFASSYSYFGDPDSDATGPTEDNVAAVAGSATLHDGLAGATKGGAP